MSDMSSLPPLTDGRGEASHLIDLPDDILLSIVHHLDHPTAAALALTCKALRPVAESRVWHALDLTTPLARDWCTGLTSLSAARPEVAKTCPGLLCVLANAAWRAPVVQAIRLSTDHLGHYDAPALLAQLTGLTDLTVAESFDGESRRFALGLDQISLPGVKQLKLEFAIFPTETFIRLVPLLPGLQALHLRHSASFLLFSATNDVPSILPMERLRELVVDNPACIPTGIAAGLIEGAPGLEKVVLRDELDTWFPAEYPGFVDGLGELQGLRQLQVPGSLAPYLGQGFLAVEHLCVAWSLRTLAGVKEPAHLMPPLPAMGAYHIEFTFRTPPSVDLELIETAPHRAVFELLRRLYPDDLGATPLLNTIRCPSGLVRGDPFSESQKDDFEGLRKFIFENSGDKLVHFRLSRLQRLEEGSVLSQIDRAWLNGGVLPRKVLQVAFALGEVDLDNEILGDAGWELLRRSRLTEL